MASLPLPDNHAELEQLLGEIARTPDETSGDALARLVGALRPRRLASPADAAAPLDGLVAVLEARPVLAQGLAAYLRTLLLSRTHRTFFAEAGILEATGYFTGFWSRILGRLLPPAVDADFLRDLVALVFDEARDAAWVQAVPYATWARLLDALGTDDAAFTAVRRHIRRELLEGLRIAAHRVAALGVDPALVRYAPGLARQESPFLAQSDAVQALVVLGSDAEAPPAYDGRLDARLDECTAVVEEVRRRSHETGVGVTLVFVLARIEQLVARMRLLRALALPDPAAPAESTRRGSIAFATALIAAETRRHSLAAVFAGTTQLLARRVTEHASKSGEHYVTETRAEYRAMFRAAAGAGLLVGAMALIKILIAKLGLPGFWQAAGFSLLYGVGFILVHIWHLTIATKQPAMTAATIAAALDGAPDADARLDRIARLAAQVSRSQLVSIAGNVLLGFVTALAIALVSAVFLGWQPVTPEKAEHLLHDLHPWRSLALLHAAIAGGYLFLAGLVSGYYDNQALYHRVPERLRRVKWLRRLIGQARLDRLAQYVEHNLGALVGNFAFGCMLGATGTLGTFFGLPLDIRHVTFAAANLAYALQALDFHVAWPVVAVSALGVALVGAINLTVSFALALRVALRSRGLGAADTAGLARRVLRRFRQSPREFLLPPRAESRQPGL